MDKQYPIPCVSLIFRNTDGEFLVLQRISDFDNGVWCAPGGKVDFGETLDCAIKREAMEETGLEVISYVWGYPFERIAQGKHYVIIPIWVTFYAGSPKNAEPHKSSALEWRKLSDMHPLAERWYGAFNAANAYQLISEKVDK